MTFLTPGRADVAEEKSAIAQCCIYTITGKNHPPMKPPKILVTGATGKTGAAVVAQLREKNWPVRAIVRSHDARSQRLERLGAEVFVADLFDPEQMATALRGTARAYYCPPFHPYMIQSAAAFAVAAREAKLESVVGLSQWLASPSHPALMTRQHWLADRMLSMIPGIAYTKVNPGFFASYPYLFLIKYASLLGIFPLPMDGHSRNAPPSNEDIARVAVAALLDPDRHAGKAYRPTGPELISVDDMVRILSRVLGRKVRHVRTPLWMFFKAARMDGLSPILLSGLGYYCQDHNHGAFEHGAPTNDVLEVTGRPPEGFETIARRHAALPEAKRNVRNTLRTFAGFMSVPFRPGFNPERFAREQCHPTPSRPQLATDSESWRLERGLPLAAGVTALPLPVQRPAECVLR